jgi:hypothetical protein
LVIPSAIAASQRSPPVIAVQGQLFRAINACLALILLALTTAHHRHAPFLLGDPAAHHRLFALARTIAVQEKLIEAVVIASRNFRAGRDSPA